jgi:predicted 2-oxoglutarate/Fe(II)-dependent dioxygenase YbiX
MSKTILIRDNYLTPYECDQLVDLFEKTPFPKNQTDGLWYQRVKWPILSDYFHQKLIVERTKISEEFFEQKLEIDNPNMTLWNAGHEMIPHSDYGTSNEFSHREYASIIYLNDDFDGGELYIPELSFENKPKKGQLVCFQGGKLYHGVKMITRGFRLTHICWFKVL